MFGEERKVVLDGLLSDLTTKHINEKDELRAKQEQQIKDLQSTVFLFHINFLDYPLCMSYQML